jgi:hypothetical protein
VEALSRSVEGGTRGGSSGWIARPAAGGMESEAEAGGVGSEAGGWRDGEQGRRGGERGQPPSQAGGPREKTCPLSFLCLGP